ncbi:zinc finger protein ZOP1 [Pistacia vera]|uniref:zinc finger protein ZOP1 n=1 Tax=Pistacia vera TaxID=55513 RepID=UPI001263D12A|nr:zinc finger protein ZOP1 [Pistacia vera]
MTEYWVSQGNKWCDFCKIYISNNPSSIRNHELGQRHRENVSKKLADMRKENAAKDKEQKEAARALEQIEAKAKRSYQKDVANLQSRDSNADALDDQEKWDYDGTSGYYFNSSNGLYYDPKSGFYYSDAIAKWVTQEEAYATAQSSVDSKHKPRMKGPLPASGAGPIKENKDSVKGQTGPAPGPVVSASLNPLRSVKGAPSSVTVGKRKREDNKPKQKAKPVNAEEAAALKAREAARKRVEKREKPLLGLYQSR